jgi:hypothetical protein
MAPQEIAEVRPRPEAFTAEVPGGLPLEDHRAKGELFAPLTVRVLARCTEFRA